MTEAQRPTSYRATPGREVFDEPLEWRVEDGHGDLICTVSAKVIATRIAAALAFAEEAATGADLPTLADALLRYKEAKS